MSELAPNPQPNATSDEAFLDLAVRYLDGTLSGDELAGFHAAMASDVAKAESFVDTCLIGKLFAESLRLELRSEESPPLPVLGFLAGAVHGTVGYFSSGWPVAYLIATVIFGIGILIGSFTYVSQPEQVATQSPSVVKETSASEPQPELIGQITGMVDCQWADSSTETMHGDRVPLGRKYTLAAGLMEITYDTGATVILQGPVTYQIESCDGGYLSIGKLTARMERKAKGSNPQSLIPNPSLSTNHYPLFTLKTPTATVTDLGTEFGVEVRESGTTSAHVFRGIVEVHPAANDGTQQGRAVRLIENESVQVERSNGDGVVMVRRERVDAVAFVRAEQLPKLAAEQRLKPFRRWQAYSQQLRRDPSLLAYYDFQQRQGHPEVLPNVAANGDHALDGVVENATWSTGRMLGKHALLFNGPSDYVSVNLPQKTDDLTLAAWICIDSLTEHQLYALLASTDWLKPGQIHWQIAHDGHLGLTCTSNSLGNCDTRPVIGPDRLHRWIHLACAYDHAAGRVCFYLDGQRVSQAEYRATGPITIGPASIGNWRFDTYPGAFDRNFRGRMDELVIFGRPLSADEVQRTYEQGRP